MQASHDPTREPPSEWDFAPLVAELRGRRLGLGLILLGWVHLAIFAACEWLFRRGDRAAAHFLPLYVLDIATAVAIFRRLVPRLGALGSARLARVAVRVWLTFAILCLTSASLNTVTGFAIDWFKISWAMLGTFGFAMMAWVGHLAFLIPAVQMSLTALLIAAYPDHAYAIFGVSWLVALNALGYLMERGRPRGA